MWKSVETNGKKEAEKEIESMCEGDSLSTKHKISSNKIEGKAKMRKFIKTNLVRFQSSKIHANQTKIDGKRKVETTLKEAGDRERDEMRVGVSNEHACTQSQRNKEKCEKQNKLFVTNKQTNERTDEQNEANELRIKRDSEQWTRRQIQGLVVSRLTH
jgi:hypothetical protein